MKSKSQFNRWQHVQRQTWPFQLFKLYNEELSTHIWAEEAAHKYVYKRLGEVVQKDDEDCRMFLTVPTNVWNFSTIKEWARAYDLSQKFLYLNCVMALSSNLETYMSAVISLAIESNPGVLLKAPKSIDGVSLLKHYPLKKRIYAKWIEACTKKEWDKRIKAFEELFGDCPEVLKNNVKTLDDIRKMRNKIGHAFGRDINKAHDFTSLTKQPQERISLKRLIKWFKITYDIATALDSFLLDNSIGEYQAILAYHNNKMKWPTRFQNERARDLKTMYGEMDQQVGLKFCNELIAYYEKV